MEHNSENNILEHADLVSMGKDVLREWWVILLVALSAAMLSYVVSQETYEPKYTSTATFTVTSRNSNYYQNLTYTQELAKQFSFILKSNALQNKVMEELGMDSFQTETSAEVTEGTNLLVLKVTAGTAMESYRAIRSILNNYRQISDKVMEDVFLETLQPPSIPSAPDAPDQSGRVSKLAALAAALGMMALLAVLSFLRDTVKKEQDARKKVDALFLGNIWHEKKYYRLKRKQERMVSMCITNPMRSFRFVEANRLAASRIRSRMDKKETQILLITSVAENEGKSTVAANLALALSQQHKKVLLIDADFRKPAQYKIFDRREKEGQDLVQVLKEGCRIQNLVQNPEGTELYAVFNRETVDRLEDLKAIGRLETILAFLRKRMDYIILDSPPAMAVADVQEIAAYADASLLVIQKDKVLSRDINDAIDMLNETKAKVLGCILNDAETLFAGGTGLRGYGYGGYYGRYER